MHGCRWLDPALHDRSEVDGELEETVRRYRGETLEDYPVNRDTGNVNNKQCTLARGTYRLIVRWRWL
jgi:hypothetical protein